MTANTSTTTANVPAQPCGDHEGIPVYRSGQAPEHLRTETQLKAERLKPSPGQAPDAYLRMYQRGSGWLRVALYDPEKAAKVRPLSAHQQRQKAARRTCILCGTAATDTLPDRRGPHLPQHGRVCDACDQAHADRYRRTCRRCRTEFQTPGGVFAGMCEPCTDARRQGQVVADRLALRHCPDCTTQTATRDDITAAQATAPYGIGLMHLPRVCPPCQADRDHRAAERRRADERARWDELGPVRAWARDVIARPHAYAVLDTETTGRDSDARVVEIGITDGAGAALLDTLVNPGIPIPDEAQAIHGIRDQDVAGAPSFGDVLPRITQALAGRRVIIYNRVFDMGVLAFELDRYHREHTPALTGLSLSDCETHPAAVAWMDTQQWDRCAMLANAVHVGDWSEYHQNWRWPRLEGGHRALGDCRAVVAVIEQIAEGRGFEFSEGGSTPNSRVQRP